MNPQSNRRVLTLRLLPLALFLLLLAFLAAGLHRDPQLISSPLLNKPAPLFNLVQLGEPQRSFSPEQLRGKVWLLNVWASWCISCGAEHPLLVALAREGGIPIYGLNYKDDPDNAERWLKARGDPYVLSVRDVDGRVGIEYGVYGVPETYLIDRQGVIRFKQVGPITKEIWRRDILPIAEKLLQ
jgi:cytochrome c biogenesis protein CcmG/thiol:disulfide interchange protein DsbE